jgi:hypothetical protein
MFWLAYVFTVIVGGTFAVILRVLKKSVSELRLGYDLRSEGAKSPRCR